VNILPINDIYPEKGADPGIHIFTQLQISTKEQIFKFTIFNRESQIIHIAFEKRQTEDPIHICDSDCD
jgi:hypothetical protein